VFSKTIRYKDFNGEDQEKMFWFHLSNAKLAMLSADGNLKTWAESMAKQQDPVQILEKIRYLVKLACGRRSADGQRFIQSEESQSELLESPAFDELLFELFVGDNASKFFNALVPPEQQKQIEELAKKQGLKTGENEDNRPVWEKENRRPKATELRNLPQDQLQKAFAWAEKFDK
jgi:hypothetical protein